MSSQALAKVAVGEAKDELTDYIIYQRLAQSRLERNPKTREVFLRLAGMEKTHYDFWQKFCPDQTIKPSRIAIFFVLLMRQILGAAFIVKYLERRERDTVAKYQGLAQLIPAEDMAFFNQMIADEQQHEYDFAEQVQGSYVKYISFVVLGLADALVEIAGIHAGSLGIYKSTEITGLAGIIAGAAASIAMASAAYAQAKQGFQGSATLSAAYTGISYFVSAVLLATPYFFTENMALAIASSLIVGVLIIGFVSYYNAVISNQRFAKNFGELTGIMFAATIALYVFGTVIQILTGITLH